MSQSTVKAARDKLRLVTENFEAIATPTRGKEARIFLS
jgi:hypothetical protein